MAVKTNFAGKGELMSLTKAQVKVLKRLIKNEGYGNYMDLDSNERSACLWLSDNGYVGVWREKIDGVHEVPSMLSITEEGKIIYEETLRKRRSTLAKGIGLALTALSVISGIVIELLH